MAGWILIDMIKLRAAAAEDSTLELPEALLYRAGNTDGLKTVRELASFRFTCRRCEDAPCISVCPADALEKDRDGVINRHTNLCIACKSCVTICPFGTMMTDFFSYHRNRDLFYNLNDNEELGKFIKASPPGTVSVTDEEESPEKNIYRLNDRVLIKDYLYLKETK